MIKVNLHQKECVEIEKKALLVIDYTHDFVATDGKLTCGEPGQALDEKKFPH